MVDFWEFAIVAVALWFIVKIVSITAGGKWSKLERKPARRERYEMGFDERQGFVVGGIVCLFMGAAMILSQEMVQMPYNLAPFVTLGGTVLGAIGLALLIAVTVLGMMPVSKRR
jgi:hypothetical protein